MMAELDRAIQRLWGLLPQIGAFAFEANNGVGSATDWNGRGEGEVSVTDHQGGWLFAEQGRYTTPHGRTLAMHNSFWWQRSERGISLSHLRHEAPVLLFELLPQSDGRWLTAEAHLCGQDHYRAELRPCEGGFELGWQITGPHKNERLEYRYRVSSAASSV